MTNKERQTIEEQVSEIREINSFCEADYCDHHGCSTLKRVIKALEGLINAK